MILDEQGLVARHRELKANVVQLDNKIVSDGAWVRPDRINIIKAMSHDVEDLKVLGQGDTAENGEFSKITKHESRVIYPTNRFFISCPYYHISIPVERN